MYTNSIHSLPPIPYSSYTNTFNVGVMGSSPCGITRIKRGY